jgi:hypothetical protein
LALACSGTCEHLPWSISHSDGQWNFATAAEAEYPALLIERIADILSHEIPPGLDVPCNIVAKMKKVDHSSLRTASGLQPRRPIAPLISEYKQTFTLNMDRRTLDSLVDKGSSSSRKFKLTKPFSHSLRDVATGTYCVGSESIHVKQRESGAASDKVGSDLLAVESFAVRFGVPWSEQEFLDQALSLKHPFGRESDALDVVRFAIDKCLINGAASTIAHRLAALSYWKQRKADLEPRERNLHFCLPMSSRAVLKGKSILLLGEMLASIDYPDTRLMTDICSGFPVVGDLPRSNMFSLLGG